MVTSLTMLFQNEERTLWEATGTYVEMSPFMSANKIKKPILLIHGEEDNNPGTLTMQVNLELVLAFLFVSYCCPSEFCWHSCKPRASIS